MSRSVSLANDELTPSAAMWLVIDNGGGSVKSCADGREPRAVPNCTAQPRKGAGLEPLVADQVVAHGTPSDLILTRPAERGYVTDVETQAEVWARVIEQAGGPEALAGLVLTVPPFEPREITAAVDAVLEQRFRLGGNVVRRQAAELVALGHRAGDPQASEFALVVDCGFSFTHVTPVMSGRAWAEGTVRIDVGGKLMSNWLAQMVSYAHFNLLDDHSAVEQMKHSCCYVSADFKQDMAELTALQEQPLLPHTKRMPRKAREALAARYVRHFALPDGQRPGVVLAPEEARESERQVVSLSAECLLVPELLFDPSLLGIRQMGLPEAIACAVDRCPVETRELLRSNVLLVGGSSCFEGFLDRLRAELGPAYNVTHVDGPATAAVRGGVRAVPPSSS